jgi:FAD/FMN-containing dehydrogenase
VVTVEPAPRLLQLDAAASAPLNHAYGTNGILTALRMPTTAAEAWQQVVVGFTAWQEALDAARQLPATALSLNALAVLEAPIASAMPWPAGCPQPGPGEVRLRIRASADGVEVLGDAQQVQELERLLAGLDPAEIEQMLCG